MNMPGERKLMNKESSIYLWVKLTQAQEMPKNCYNIYSTALYDKLHTHTAHTHTHTIHREREHRGRGSERERASVHGHHELLTMYILARNSLCT